MTTPHESFSRLMDAAEKIYRINPSVTSLKNLLSLEYTNVYMWKERGVSSEQALLIEKNFGISAVWIYFGVGQEMAMSKTMPASIKQIVDLMMQTDDRGRNKMLNAALDAFDTHQAWRASLPSPYQTTENRINKARDDIFSNENSVNAEKLQQKRQVDVRTDSSL